MAEGLCQRFGVPPVSIEAGDAGAVEAMRGEIRERLAENHAAFADDLASAEAFAGFLAQCFTLSPYLRDCALVRPDILAETLAAPFDDGIEALAGSTRALWRECEDEAALMAALRLAKRRAALTLGLADLGGYMVPAEITAHLSTFADAALGAACDFLLRRLHDSGKIVLADPDNPSPDSGLIILAMGKYGARELNYSSDIDIILFFDLECGLRLETDDPTSLFVRFAKQFSRILQERTGEGYVFRVDLRLRPDPGSTPLAIPVATAFNYYEAYGQNWERAAFIKARAVAGDVAAGEKFLAGLMPFIWRKYLDFAAIQDVHSIKRQIHTHKGFGEIAVRGHNVKLGRGGIREIEFFVQTQQLIAGGRRPQLRKVGTIDALAALCADGWIDKPAAEALSAAYWYLRKVEHRIQMVADEQTHIIPENEAELDRIARMMGHGDTETFSRELIEIMRSVETHYAALFEASPELTGKGGNLVFTGDDDPATLETLSRLGFKQPAQIVDTIRGWHYGRLPAVRSPQARELLTELSPSLVEAFAESDNPDQAFFAFDRFLSGLPAGLQFFAILNSNPDLTRLLTQILGSAPRLTRIVTRKPHVFDALIDPSLAAALPDRDVLSQRLETGLARARDYEARLDQTRSFAAEQRFLIGVRLINRTINARQAGNAFSVLAEVLLEAILRLVREEYEEKHGRVAGGEIAVIGMGRLGSRELTAGSDLDLIFLYRHDPEVESSDGDKPLHPQQYFVRLVQRLMAAMSAPTAEGVLYELDFRLRPSGNAGPLATHFDAFVKYQKGEAWTWEAQALTRARAITGDAALLAAFEKVHRELLETGRDEEKLRRDIAEMRATIDREKPASSPFDVKLAEGGLIDIEFISQWGVLASAAALPGEDRSVIGLIDALPDACLAPGDRETLKHAYTLYNSVLQLIRLCLDGDFDPDEAAGSLEDEPAGAVPKNARGLARMLAEQTGTPDLAALRVLLKETQEEIRGLFNRLIGDTAAERETVE